MRNIKGYEGRYAITRDGRVWSYPKKRKVGGNKGHFLKLSFAKSGYAVVTLCNPQNRKVITVHRLVALTYIPNPNNLLEVNHKDTKKTNNRVDNLEWCTTKENVNHASKAGLLAKRFTAKQVKEIRSLYASNKYTQKEIADLYRTGQPVVSGIILRRVWKHI